MLALPAHEKPAHQPPAARSALASDAEMAPMLPCRVSVALQDTLDVFWNRGMPQHPAEHEHDLTCFRHISADTLLVCVLHTCSHRPGSSSLWHLPYIEEPTSASIRKSPPEPSVHTNLTGGGAEVR